MNAKQERNARMDTLARGSRCTRCGVLADEPCRTPKGRETFPHKARRDRAVKQYIAARDAKRAAEPRYEVECQEDCNDGTRHEVTYSHDTNGKKVYVAVCNDYEDYYTEDVVFEVQAPKETLGLDLRQVPEVQDTKTELVTVELPDGSTRSRRLDLYGDGSELALFLSEVIGRNYRNLNQEPAGRRDDGTQVWLLIDHRGDVRATVYKKRGITQ